ncbi:hypothetical protein T02_1559 [Trichinella nativa]|uniref:Uncharacterized protein n=1 Tax=Trichinella nativa TaxID=6335 RepID=A0A0V1KMT0_9BILA|nr:hypothetical protein T02_1559 [Trichinella nativa]
MSIITVGTVAAKLLYSCEPRVFVIERARIVSMKTFLVDKQETRYCYDMKRRQERRYCYYMVSG